MNQPSHITTLRQTHHAATSILPVLTATLTVVGAVLAAMEARAPQPSDQPAGADEQTSELGHSGGQMASRATARRVTLRAYIATLVGRVLLVALGITLVLSLVYTASISGRTGQAILLTALILLALYLTEKIARRA